ncbi:hypothetical protein BDV98DRAFT_564078 [Pterulicium gracile]|uniref:Uncharacterized protein n=1 Tax=Pterulicium gracile TaxID=1884261 RepID=A0A5C3QN60_9AGAR|nr:hypothetical protein BDV98DRAFT_564078 [Pterula gracilis]
MTRDRIDWAQVERHLTLCKFRLSIFLARSRSNPLQIRLELTMMDAEAVDLPKTIIPLLWPHSARWSSFSLRQCFRNGDWVSGWMEQRTCLRTLPQTKTLSLHLNSRVSAEDSELEIGAFYCLFNNCPSAHKSKR